MATIKSFTDLEQSRNLAEILPFESADMRIGNYVGKYACIDGTNVHYYHKSESFEAPEIIPCWSLAALLNILHSNAKDIPSLSGGGYKDGKYISDWCLDYEFENGYYQKTFADNPVDACVEMIEKLHEQKLL